METRVTFDSDGLKLAGVLGTPNGGSAGERRPALMLLHGFGSNKDSKAVRGPARLFQDWGYVTLRFDMRGCGESEGRYGHILCEDQVRDTRNALSYLQGQEGIDPDRIGAVGHSFGAAVAVYAGGEDTRLAAVISSGGWGDGERKFRRQHSTPEAWEKFIGTVEKGRRLRQESGETLMMSRFDIVPIPEHLRANLAPGSHMEFPVDTAESMLRFQADNVVGGIAPRPLLLLHSATDSVTPAEESLELYRRAGQPSELHMMTGVDHFMFSEANARVNQIVRDWLDVYLPLRQLPRAP